MPASLEQRKALLESYRGTFDRYAAELLWIKGTAPGTEHPFRLNPSQRVTHLRLERQRKRTGWTRGVIIKGRQFGASTYGSGRLFHMASLNRNVSTLLVALDDTSTSRIFDMVRHFHDKLKPAWKPLTRYSSKTELVFENPDKRTRFQRPGLSSRMDFQSSKQVHAGVSTTRHGLHISELARWNDQHVEVLMSSLLPAIHLEPGTMILMESTAFVTGKVFHDTCDMARTGKTEWVFIFIPWFLTPSYRAPLEPGEKLTPTAEEKALIKLAARGDQDYDIPPVEITSEHLKWRRNRIEAFDIANGGNGEQWFKQEYPATYDEAWIDLDSRVFPDEMIDAQRRNIHVPERMVDIQRDPPRIITTTGQPDPEKDYCAIWREPQLNHTYDLGCDVAFGSDDGDWSVAQIFDRDTHEQVCEYHKHVTPMDLGDDIAILGRYYNNAQLGVEMNSLGFVTHQRVIYLAYPYIYRWRHRDFDTPKLSNYAGWKTQLDSKKFMIAQFHQLMKENRLCIHSRVLLEELRDFLRYDEDRYGAGRGHDDAAMAAFIAIVIGVDESFGANTRPMVEKMDRKAQLEAAVKQMMGHAVDNEEIDTKPDKVTKRFVEELQGHH